MNVASESAIVPRTSSRPAAARSAAPPARRRRRRRRRRGDACRGHQRARWAPRSARRVGAAARRGAPRPRVARRRRRGRPRLAAMISLTSASACSLPRSKTLVCARAGRCAASARTRPSVLPTSTLASIDRPTRSGCCGDFLRIERDPHRHALHDLDPVAGRVLRRQQGERRAGAGAEAFDRAVVRDLLAVDVGLELGRLADAQVAQLAFLEVGVDPDVVERDDREQRRAGLDALAELDAAPRDVAVDRRDAARRGAARGSASRTAPRRAARSGAARPRCSRSATGSRRAARAPPAVADSAAASADFAAASCGVDVVELFLADRAGPHQRRAPRDVVLARADVALRARARSASRAAICALSVPLLTYIVRTSRTACASCASACSSATCASAGSSLTSGWPALTKSVSSA